MSRRRILTLAAAILIAVGAIAVISPFISGLGPGVKALDGSWKHYELSELEAGSIKKLDWIWVYRRTARDFESYEIAKQYYQESSNAAEIPAEANNALRSSNPDYFVFFPYAPNRGCGVEFRDGYKYRDFASTDQLAIAAFPHFFEPCEGRVFDTTGRVLSRPSWPREDDLLVPPTEWRDEFAYLSRWHDNAA